MREPMSMPVRDVRVLRVAMSNCTARRRLRDRTSQYRQWQSAIGSVLSLPAALEKVGTGTLCVLSEDEHGKTYGRALTVADRLGQDRVLLAKWIRRLTNWNGRQVPLAVWEEKIVPLVKEKLAQQKTPVVSFQNQAQRILALVSIADLTLRVPVDRHGVALWKPVEREVLPADCAQCPLVPVCRQLPTSTGVALLWRRLGPGGCRRRADPARPGRQLLQPG